MGSEMCIRDRVETKEEKKQNPEKVDNEVKQVSEFEKKDLFDPNNIAALIDNVKGSVSSGKESAELSGKSTWTPTVNNGAVTINIISNTNITSTNGVTFISLIGSFDERLNLKAIC